MLFDYISMFTYRILIAKIGSNYKGFSNYFEDVFSSLNDNVANAVSKLTTDLTANNALLDNANDTIANVAAALVGLMFSIEIINKLTEKGEDFRYTDAAFSGMKFSIILSITNMSQDVMAAIAEKASSMVTDLTSKSNTGSGIKELGEQFTNMLIKDDGLGNLMSNLSVFLTSLVPTLILWICAFIILVISYARWLEIKALSTLSPIAFSFLPFRGTSDVTKRFIFAYAAVCLQAVVIVLCLIIFASLQDGAYTTFTTDVSTLKPGSDAYMTKVSTFKNSTIVHSVLLVFAMISSGKWA